MFLLWIMCALFGLLFPLTKSEGAILIANNKSITFHCNNNIDNIRYIRWSFFPHLINSEQVIYCTSNGFQYASYALDFTVKCTLQSCNLTLLQAKDGNAGTYKCKVYDPQVIERTILEIILSVGKLECHTNSGSSVLLSENDCTNYNTSILEKTCLVKMSGNITKSPVLSWSRRYKNDSILEENPPFEYNTVLDGVKSYEFKQTLTVTADMDEMILQCKLKNYDGLEPCVLPALDVQYAKEILNNTKLIDMKNLHDVMCSVNKSDKVNCDYEWFYQEDKVTTSILGSILESKARKYAGFYYCKATCKTGDKKCTINAMTVEVKDSSIYENFHSSTILISVLLSIIVIAVLTAVNWFNQNRRIEQ